MTSVCKAIKEAGLLLHINKENRQWKIKEGGNHAQEFADKSCLLLGSGAVKLIIFDLDNTLWKGEIAEACGMVYNEDKMIFIKKLVKAGVMVSICSRNEKSIVIEILKSKGMLDYFIFPQINTTQSKGPMVANILKNCNLRAENCLFVDDELRNYGEVWESTKCLGAHPDLFWLCLLGTFDYDYGGDLRLAQYKVMEVKHKDKEESGISTEEFLKRSAVKVTLQKENLEHLAQRLHDLFERANQLNFTKTRLTKEELLGELGKAEVQAAAIHIRDYYGDYGISGFYLLENGELKHYVFSCRVLGMNVETAVYQYLGKPKLKEIPPLAVNDLCSKNVVDYITINQGVIDETGHLKKPLCISIKGSCATVTLASLLANHVNYEIKILEYNLPEPFGFGHSDSIVLQNGFTKEKDEVLTHYRDFNITDLGERYVILHLFRDLRLMTFKSKTEEDLHIPFGELYNFSTILDKEDYFRSTYQISDAFINAFKANYGPAGIISAKRFHSNIALIFSKLPADVKMILMNFHELPVPTESYHTRCEFNKVIDHITLENHEIKLLDVRKYCLSEDDFLENTPNDTALVKRHVFHKLAQELQVIIEDEDYRILNKKSSKKVCQQPTIAQ